MIYCADSHTYIAAAHIRYFITGFFMSFRLRYLCMFKKFGKDVNIRCDIFAECCII